MAFGLIRRCLTSAAVKNRDRINVYRAIRICDFHSLSSSDDDCEEGSKRSKTASDHLSFAQHSLLMEPNQSELQPRVVKQAAIIGGGLMGSAIAAVLLEANIPVFLKDIDREALEMSIQSIRENLIWMTKNAYLVGKAMSNLTCVLNYTDFRYVDLVIEAVSENVSLKHSVFKELEKVCSRHCILATSSSMDLNLVGAGIFSQDRFVGAHFFRPAHLTLLLEIACTVDTSTQVVLDMHSVGLRIHKWPIIVGNGPGFAVNRTFLPYTQGAHILLHLGVEVLKIERVMTNFGMLTGPFEYFGSTTTGPDHIIPLIKIAKPVFLSDLEIRDMILFPIVNEACRVIDEHIVIHPYHLDVVSLIAIGFPRYRGGILFWAESVGLGRIYQSLKRWSVIYGRFFEPSDSLEKRVRATKASGTRQFDL